MPSLTFEKPTKEKPKGRWVLQYNIYINGIAKKPAPRIRRVKKSDIPKALQFAVTELEEATKTGLAATDQINKWVNGYPEFGFKKPLISFEDAVKIWMGYRDELHRGGRIIKTDINKVIEHYSDQAFGDMRKNKSVGKESRSHRNTMNELDLAIRSVGEICPNVMDMTQEDYYKWWLSLQQTLKESTVNKRNDSLRKFFDICVRLNMVAKSPYLKERCPRLEVADAEPRRILSESEAKLTVSRLKEKRELYEDPQGRTNPMHGCLPISTYLGLYSGLRTEEMRWLEWSVLRLYDKRQSFLYIQPATCASTGRSHSAKNGNWRTLGVNTKLKELLKHEEKRQERLGIKGQFIIPSGRFNRPSSRNTVIGDNQVSRSYGEFNENEIDIYENDEMPTYYSYRHTYCTSLLRSNVDIRTVQKRMGHKKLSTTERYLREIEAEDETVEEALPY